MTTLLDAVAAGLRASADVHEAERIPHLVDALRALADALDAYEPIEPGPCPGRLELKTVGPDGQGGLRHGVDVAICRLRATHAGLHEESPTLGPHGPVPGQQWSDPDSDADPNAWYWAARAEQDRQKLAAVNDAVAEMVLAENASVRHWGGRLAATLRGKTS